MFKRLVGNERVKELLMRMVASRRVPGALLFAGENGVGKRLFALTLASALNCSSAVDAEGFCECAVCVRTARFVWPTAEQKEENKSIIWSGHPDVGLVRPFGRFLTVGQMRQVEREANFRPYEGNARVFLIEDADQLNDASSNALLKTLEEPPDTSHLILITSRPLALLPTIRSRCQMVQFTPLLNAEIESYLAGKKTYISEDTSLLARMSRGSIGRALEASVDNYRGWREAMLRVLYAIVIAEDRSILLRTTEDIADPKRKDEYEQRLDVLETLLHDAWMVALGAPNDSLVNSDVLPQLVEISRRLDTKRAAAWLLDIEELRSQLAVNINKKIATDSLLLSMVAA